MFSYQLRAYLRNLALLGIMLLSTVFSPAGAVSPTTTALAQDKPTDLPQPASVKLQINGADYNGPTYWDEFPQAFSITTAKNGAQRLLPGPDSQVRLIVQLRGDPLAVYQLRLRATLSESSPDYAAQLAAYQASLQATRQQALATLSAAGVSYRLNREYGYLFNGMALSVTQDHWRTIADLPQVKAVFPDYLVKATLEDSVPLIGAPQVWAMTDPEGDPVTGEGLRVAIVDTGVDYTHPDLGGCLGASCKVIGGYDFINSDPDPMDDHGHGTHVAGIVAADGTLQGVAPGASLLAYKVLNQYGSGMDSDIIAAIEMAADPDGNPATDDGAQVLNMSLGGPGNPDDPFSQAVDHAVELGMVVVVAAGNDGMYYSLGAPASARKAITVAASDKQDEMAWFSSRGPVPGYFDLVKPEITAPGVAITSTASVTGVLSSPSGYIALDGTSMASPHVAGAAALLRQLHPAWTPAQIKASLMNTAVDLEADMASQGAGRVAVNQAAAVTSLVSPGALSFGMDDVALPIWSSARAITVTNISTVSLTYALTATLPFTQGVSLVVSPTHFTLLPGASQVVSAAITVDNALVPYPTSPAMSYEAAIHLQAGGQPVRVPYAFYKASSLRINFSDENPWLLILHNRLDSSQLVFVSPGVTQTLTYLQPGAYDIVSSYEFTRTVFNEGIPVSGTASLTVSPLDAKNQLSFHPLGKDGGDLPLSDPKNMLAYVWSYGGMVSSSTIGSLCWGEAECPPVLNFSDVSANYQLETRLNISANGGQEYYDLLNEFAGLSEDRLLQNDPAQFRTTRMDFRPHASIAPYTLRRYFVDVYPFMVMGISFSDWDVNTTGSYSERVYFTPSSEDVISGYLQFEVVTNPFEPNEKIHYSTPLIHAPESANALRLRRVFEPPLPGEVGKNLLVGPAPLHWDGKLTVADPQTLNIYNSVLLADQSQAAANTSPVSYTLSHEGATVFEGLLPVYGWGLPEPGAYTMTVTHRGYQLGALEGQGQATIVFDTTRADPNPPQLLSLNVLENGYMSDAVTKFGLVRFTLADESPLQQVTLWLKRDVGEWQSIPLTQDGYTYTADLYNLPPAFWDLRTPANVQGGGAFLSLRLTAQDAAGNWLTYETDPAFVLITNYQPQLYLPLMRR